MTAEQTIATLKIRLFDTNEQLAGVQNQAKEFSDALTKIVQILGVQPHEGEDAIALADIVDAVARVAPVAEAEVEGE